MNDNARLRATKDAQALRPLLRGCRDWTDATRSAQRLVDAGMPDTSAGGSMQFFATMSSKLLAVLLHSASVMDQDFARVDRWISRISDQATHQEVDSILLWAHSVKGTEAWVGFLTREHKLRGDIAATVESLLMDARAKGQMLGRSPVIYRAVRLTSTAAAERFRDDEDVRQAMALLARLPDSRGLPVLARDAHSISWGLPTTWRTMLPTMKEAAFFELDVAQIEEEVGTGRRALRARADEDGVDAQGHIDQLSGRRRLVPTLMIFGPGEHERRDKMLDVLADSTTARPPIILLDLTGAPVQIDDAVTHVLLDEGAMPATSDLTAGWQEPERWDALRESEQMWAQQRVEGAAAEEHEPDAAYESPAAPAIADLQDFAVPTLLLSEVGRKRLSGILGDEVERVPLVVLALTALRGDQPLSGILSQADMFSSELSPSGAPSRWRHAPLVLAGAERGEIELRMRHQPSIEAAGALATGGAQAVAWAHVPEGAPETSAVRQAYAAWTGSAAHGRNVIGEVLVWDVDVSELTDDPVEPARVILPTGHGLPR
jgi:hypothetical protein